MKKIGDIMEEMGFRNDASDSVKEAFLKHLIKSATGVTVETPSERRWKKSTHSKSAKKKNPTASKQKENSEPKQLAFDFYQDLSHKKDKAS